MPNVTYEYIQHNDAKWGWNMVIYWMLHDVSKILWDLGGLMWLFNHLRKNESNAAPMSAMIAGILATWMVRQRKRCKTLRSLGQDVLREPCGGHWISCCFNILIRSPQKKKATQQNSTKTWLDDCPSVVCWYFFDAHGRDSHCNLTVVP